LALGLLWAYFQKAVGLFLRLLWGTVLEVYALIEMKGSKGISVPQAEV
jgi:hypothetical protein